MEPLDPGEELWESGEVTTGLQEQTLMSTTAQFSPEVTSLTGR